jgi:hypothetical protein
VNSTIAAQPYRPGIREERSEKGSIVLEGGKRSGSLAARHLNFQYETIAPTKRKKKKKKTREGK